MNEVQKPKLLTILHIALIIIGFVIVGNFAYSIYGLWKRGDVVIEKEARLRELEAEQEHLKNQLSYTLRQEFIEEEARNKLNMIRPGETLVVLPQQGSPSGEMKVETMVVSEAVEETTTIRKWWNLFLGRG